MMRMLSVVAVLAAAFPMAANAAPKSAGTQPGCCATKTRCCPKSSVKYCCDEPTKATCCKTKTACCDMAGCCGSQPQAQHKIKKGKTAG
jgi:hypothetical protein